MLNYDYIGSATHIDPCGVGRTLDLILITGAAATHWEGSIDDEHTITINYRWADIDDSKGWPGDGLFLGMSGLLAATVTL